jgi:hypothetical protein
MSRLLNRRSIVVASLVALLAAAGAYAYWTQSGSGNGSAASKADGSDIVVNQTSTPANLTPGSTPQALSGTFTNTNAGHVYVGHITATLTSVSNGTNGTPAITTDDCTIADYAIAGGATTANVIDFTTEVASGSPSATPWSGLTIALLDRAGVNQNACKGATINIGYTIS